MGNEAIRRLGACNRKVLPWYQALFYLKSLTHTEELYPFFNSPLPHPSLSLLLR